ncbi:MAG: metal ABC transporter permease [Alkalispirochaeta sp.]
MAGIERGLIWIVTRAVTHDELNAFFRDPETTAILIGGLIAISGGILGTFLLLRGMALTADAISHTVLLGIVVVFMMTAGIGREPSLSSPWLLVGAVVAGVGTVALTELVHRSGLLKQDAALGLVFPLLFAIAVLLVSRYTDDVHLDEDAVMVGEIGLAWADTSSHCFGDCESVVITPDDPRAVLSRRCTNCRTEGISPRDAGARFVETCTNCGEYSPAAAYRAGLTTERPATVFWPASLTVVFVLMVITVLFVLVFYKELKISTFDPALAKVFGFRPAGLQYAIMTLVSLVAVGAFNAVGSILVIAFFVLPAATAFLLTERLSVMLVLSGIIGTVAVWLGYGLARGDVFIFDLNTLVPGGWNTSISASMVVMMFLFFVTAFLVSPRHGVFSAAIRRVRQTARFQEYAMMGHITHHSGTADEVLELTLATLSAHIQWPPPRVRRVCNRLVRRSLVRIDDRGVLVPTEKGKRSVARFIGGSGRG